MQERDSFNSQLGLILAAIGSAVGLGNIWRFPYLVGQNGGAVFIFVYLIFVVSIGVALVMSELLVGRRTKSNAVEAYRKLGGNTAFNKVGYLQVMVSFFILSFYVVVGG
jgi:NSS family neurotransmitter:Na+ symporter